MRRLSLLLCALVLALAASAPNLLHAKPAHAYADCSPQQGDNIVYERTDLYRSAQYWVWDVTSPSNGHNVDIDLKTYQVSGYGLCWRSYYVSEWTEDGTSAWLSAAMRTWVCGQGPWYQSDGAAAWQNNRAVTPQTPWGPSTWHRWPVQMWDGSWVSVVFAPYGTWDAGNLCGPQADSGGSAAEGQYWYNPQHLDSPMPGGGWYVSGW